MKYDFNNMVLPEFDIIQGVPYIMKLKSGHKMLFEIPTVEEYFKFEKEYATILVSHFALFKDVKLLEYKDFSSKKLLKAMFEQIHSAMQEKKFKKDFIKILSKYFDADFNIKKLMKVADPLELSNMFLICHKIIETVKKKFIQNLESLGIKMGQGISSISSSDISKKIVPRFSK